MPKKSLSFEYSTIENGKVIVSVFLDGKNVSIYLGLFEFVNEMEILGITTKFQKVNSKVGFIFDEDIDKAMLENEIKRFASQYDIV